uniref:Uncharacterized protein n=1 Tax=Tanacetum cinerariifolium TaxID=118510 RepID=A0A699GPS2_TANCI|nr:hypothetical protein [Tanacetum cinerariifolium]
MFDVQISTSDSEKQKVKTNDGYDVFETYSILCARNVRPWSSYDLPQTPVAGGFHAKQTTSSDVEGDSLSTYLNHTGLSVCNQHKKLRQNSQADAVTDKVGPSKRVCSSTVTVWRADRQASTVACANTEACSSAHSTGSSAAWLRISKKRTKSKPKPDKIKHEMESVEKSIKSKSKSNQSKRTRIWKEHEKPKPKATCSKCNSEAGNSFIYDPTPKSFNEVQSIFNPPPQSHYKIYLCQLCESNSHYGYECSQRVPLVYEPDPCYNQSFGNNDYPHDSPGVTPLIDHHCCYKCGDLLDGFFCHQCICKFCENGAHDGYNCPSHVPFIKTLSSFPQQYPCCEDCGVLTRLFNYSVNPSLNIQNEFDNHELFINELIQQKLKNKYAQPFTAIAITFDLPTVEPEDSLRIEDEHLDPISETESNEFIKSGVENLVSNPSESEDEHECDVPACNDFTTFSNLLFDADDDFSSSDNESFSDEDISKEIYSNPLFDEEIISMKIDPHHFNTESHLIESLLNHDSSIISLSSKIYSLLDEFAGELILLISVPLGIDETDYDHEKEIRLIEKLLYDNSSLRPPEEFISENSDAEIESFSPSPIPVEDTNSLMEEIDLTLTPDDSMPPGIEDDNYDSEGDILE